MNLSLVYIVIFVIIIFIIFLTYYIMIYQNRFRLNNTNQIKNIAILTLEDRDEEYIKCHNNSVNNYCNKHGYKYIFQEKYPSDLPVYWHKLLFVKDHLIYYDYILWLDSDTIICNDNIRLESLLLNEMNEMSGTNERSGINEMNETDQKHKMSVTNIYIGSDYPGGIFQAYCSGVFMIKNSKESINFIDDCINHYLNNDDCKDNDKNILKGKWAGMCYEQGVMNYMIKSKYKSIVKNIPCNIFMTDPNNEESDFILHLCGKGKSKIPLVYNKIISSNK